MSRLCAGSASRALKRCWTERARPPRLLQLKGGPKMVHEPVPDPGLEVMGRPSHEPEAGHRKQVEALAGFGVPETDIARVIGIDPKTLRKYYRDELDCGHI